MNESAENWRRSMRLQRWDYSREGAYFITVCTQNREYLFGEICQNSMQLNAPGTMVVEVWDRLPDRFDFMQLDVRVLMPNHLHAIVVIRRGESSIRPSATLPQNIINFDQHNHLDRGEHKVRPYGKIRPRGTAEGSIGRIVQAFKSITTHQYLQGIRECGWQPFPVKLWQRNYYEHIVRDEEEWQLIRDYIAGNPINWAMDRENCEAGQNISSEPWRILSTRNHL
jgi:REP element-mobilizing transposase RayT